jgi:hypothetical protein
MSASPGPKAASGKGSLTLLIIKPGGGIMFRKLKMPSSSCARPQPAILDGRNTAW